ALARSPASRNPPSPGTATPGSGASGQAAATGVAEMPASDGGMDVDVPAAADLYVIVLVRPNDPTASEVACGNPLSDRRQYFDLYPPTNNSIATGNALFDPITVTHVAISPAGDGATQAIPSSWTVRQGSCDGAVLGNGEIARGSSAPYGGTVFAALAPVSWWVTLRFANGAVVCGQTKSGG
ncbi:MAG: hypothetical protein ACHQ4H_14125, partial [Ktedonobacterales bacterium]